MIDCSFAVTSSRKPYNRTFFVGLLVATLLQADMSAYLDPGSGSMIIQGLIAALAALGYTLRIYWSRIRQFLGRKEQSFSDADNKQRLGH